MTQTNTHFLRDAVLVSYTAPKLPRVCHISQCSLFVIGGVEVFCPKARAEEETVTHTRMRSCQVHTTETTRVCCERTS